MDHFPEFSTKFTRITRLTIILIVATTLLSGCASIVANPVFLNPALESAASRNLNMPLPLSVKARLTEYLGRKSPAFFFVANDGGHSLSWGCVESYCDYDGAEEYRNAKKECEDLRLGMECTLLFLRDQPVVAEIKFKTKLTAVMLTGDTSIPPEKAHGKIIYMPGFSGWSNRGHNFPPSMEDDQISPVLEELERNDWDVDVLNILHADRAYLGERFDLYEKLLSDEISSARKSGYQRVILYGGSRGGAEIMHSVLAGAKPDAIALMEPDWYGPKYDKFGQFNDDHKIRAQEIKSLLAKQKVDRIVFSFFKNSRWYADITRDEIKSTLGLLGTNYFLIGAPGNLEGHGGSWTQRFSNLYAQCLHQFFLGEIDSETACELPAIDNTKHENWATNTWIKEGNFESLSGKEILEFTKDKALCSYTPGKNIISKINCQVWSRDRRKKGFRNEFGTLFVSSDIIDLNSEGFCRHNGLYSPTYRCAKFYVINKNLIAITPEDRNDFYWYRLVDKNKIVNTFKLAKYSCDNESKLESVVCRRL